MERASSRGLIINLAPTGAVATRLNSPHVPLSVEEIVRDSVEGIAAGASIVHIHARTESGAPTYRKDIYGNIVGGIRESRPDAIICVSLSGREFSAFEQRADPLFLSNDLKPDMASLTLSSLNFARTASVNSPEMIVRLASTMAERGIKPELEVFDLGMMNYAKYLIKRNLLQRPFYFNIILGNVASAQAAPSHLGLLLSELPEGSLWSAGGIGNAQLPMTAMGILYADGVRIGLEDCLWMDQQRQTLATNPGQVRRVEQLCNLLGREIATPAEARVMLAI